MANLTASSSRHAGPGEVSRGAGREHDRPAGTIARDAGLDAGFDPGRRLQRPPFELTDIHSGVESTRLRLFLLTGNYWRGP